MQAWIAQSLQEKRRQSEGERGGKTEFWVFPVFATGLKGRMERFCGKEVPKAASLPAISAAQAESKRTNAPGSNRSGRQDGL